MSWKKYNFLYNLLTYGEPFVLVEANAIGLKAEIEDCRHDKHNCDCKNEVIVTIGLFTIIKIYRIVNLLVESPGFCIPKECKEVKQKRPCDFFDELDFPLDVFDPPQKKEFFEGKSNNIKNERRHECDEHSKRKHCHDEHDECDCDDNWGWSN